MFNKFKGLFNDESEVTRITLLQENINQAIQVYNKIGELAAPRVSNDEDCLLLSKADKENLNAILQKLYKYSIERAKKIHDELMTRRENPHKKERNPIPSCVLLAEIQNINTCLTQLIDQANYFYNLSPSYITATTVTESLNHLLIAITKSIASINNLKTTDNFSAYINKIDYIKQTVPHIVWEDMSPITKKNNLEEKQLLLKEKEEKNPKKIMAIKKVKEWELQQENKEKQIYSKIMQDIKKPTATKQNRHHQAVRNYIEPIIQYDKKPSIIALKAAKIEYEVLSLIKCDDHYMRGTQYEYDSGDTCKIHDLYTSETGISTSTRKGHQSLINLIRSLSEIIDPIYENLRAYSGEQQKICLKLIKEYFTLIDELKADFGSITKKTNGYVRTLKKLSGEYSAILDVAKNNIKLTEDNVLDITNKIKKFKVSIQEELEKLAIKSPNDIKADTKKIPELIPEKIFNAPDYSLTQTLYLVYFIEKNPNNPATLLGKGKKDGLYRAILNFAEPDLSKNPQQLIDLLNDNFLLQSSQVKQLIEKIMGKILKLTEKESFSSDNLMQLKDIVNRLQNQKSAYPLIIYLLQVTSSLKNTSLDNKIAFFQQKIAQLTKRNNSNLNTCIVPVPIFPLNATKKMLNKKLLKKIFLTRQYSWILSRMIVVISVLSHKKALISL